MMIIVREREPDRKVMWRNLTSPNGTEVPGSRYVEYEGWRPIRVVNKGGLIIREPIPESELRPVNFRRTTWEAHILESAHLLSRGVAVAILKNGVNHDLQPLDSFKDGGSVAKNTLARLHAVNRRLVGDDSVFEGPEEARIRHEKAELLKKVSSTMKRSQDYAPISDMMNIICAESVDPSREAVDTISMLNIDIRTLLLLAGSENKMLIGTRDRVPTWRRFRTPPLYEGFPAPIYHLTQSILFLQDIGENVKPAFPTRTVFPQDLEKLNFPEPNQNVEESLEEIFYKQRYIMNGGGVDLELEGAGDALGMVLVESRGMLFANTRTRYGELFTGLFLDRALGISGEMGNEYAIGRRSPHELFTSSRLAALVVSQYAYLLCGREVARPGNRRSPGTKNSKAEDPNPDDSDKSPRASRVRIVTEDTRSKKEPLLIYDGPPKPVKPHQVAGHVKRAGKDGISGVQKEAVREFVKSTGLRVPRPKPGQTIVLPYYVPAESGKAIKNMPTFLRAKIQETAFKGVKEMGEDMAGYIGPDNVDEIFPPKSQ